VKLASVGAAAVGFGVVAALARGAHPGGAGGTGASTSSGSLDVSSRISQEAQQSDGFFGSGSSSGSVSPSQSSSPPQASTHTS